MLPVVGVAVAALRWDSSDFADEVLSAVLVNESEALIRQAVTGAYSMRPMTDQSVVAHAKAATQDTDSRVRLGATENLWKARFIYPTVAGIVTKVAKTDPDPEVRAKVQEMLDAP